MKRNILIGLVVVAALVGVWYVVAGVSKEDRPGEEQIRVAPREAAGLQTDDSTANSVTGNATMQQLSTFPNKVILTGLAQHRLVSIYKARPVADKGAGSSFRYDYAGTEDETHAHFMPGIDILFGYNLLNIAHYDMELEKMNFLFDHPVLVKTVYYPSFVQDSVDKKPVNRNYYLVSAYDEDTNKDSLINKNDMRRFYHFDAKTSFRTQLIPADHSAIRSQYDPKNDVMYVFASHDVNRNGTPDKSDPIHIFWFSLNTPGKAKRLY